MYVASNAVCRSCLWDPSVIIPETPNGEKAICLHCKMDTIVGVDEVTEKDMRQYLRIKNVCYKVSATYEEILSIYHLTKSNDDDIFLEAIDEVQYPLLPASTLHPSQLFAFAPDSKIRPIIDDLDKSGPIENILNPELTTFRFCGDHDMEWVRNKSTTRKLQDGTTKTIKIPPFEAPVGTGGKGFRTPTKTVSKGLGTDRHLFRHVTETRDNNEFGLALQQTHEMEDVRSGKQSLNDINQRLVEAAGLDVHCGVAEFVTPAKENLLDETMEEKVRPCVKPEDLTPKEVKRRTGFRDLPSLLSFAAIVCDGDSDLLFKTCSKLTWLEEWLFFFEFEYGRTACRWADYTKMYDCSKKPLRKVLKKKLKLQLSTRDRWPMYANYEEDGQFRSKSWDVHFDREKGSRIIMHDATNICLPCPSKAEQQRALFSEYYGTTCAKGGVSNQLCGWIRAIPLFTGRITDSQMIKDSNILVQQKLFSEADSSSDKPFTNVFDKGFRNTLDAAMEKQLCMQPKYAKGDRQFSGKETLHTACVAVIRSGNERAVQRCKMSWFLKRRCAYQLWSIDLVCDIWESWKFQSNFMYDKFL